MSVNVKMQREYLRQKSRLLTAILRATHRNNLDALKHLYKKKKYLNEFIEYFEKRINNENKKAKSK